MKALLDIFLLVLSLYVWVIIAAAIFSWLYNFNIINPRNQVVSVVGNTLYQMTEPVLRPIRRYMPDLGGLDISPLAVILAIYLIQRIIALYVYPNVF